MLSFPPWTKAPLRRFGSVPSRLPWCCTLRSIWRNRLRADAGKLRKACVYSSLILTTLVLLVLMNGFLDKSPRSTVRTVVIGKARHTSRGGTDYTLTVASWRPRRATEEFQVSSFDFQHAVVGRTVRIELHKGFFNLPWSGNISPE